MMVRLIPIYREDWEFLCRNEALPEERMRAVETGGCPHAAIREVTRSFASTNYSYVCCTFV